MSTDSTLLLDKFYTKDSVLSEIANSLEGEVNPSDWFFLDFSAGNNHFAMFLQDKGFGTVSIDIDPSPEHANKVHVNDWLLCRRKGNVIDFGRDSKTPASHIVLPDQKLCIGLNPPFGIRFRLGIKFIEHALTFEPDMLVLIVPVTGINYLKSLKKFVFISVKKLPFASYKYQGQGPDKRVQTFVVILKKREKTSRGRPFSKPYSSSPYSKPYSNSDSNSDSDLDLTIFPSKYVGKLKCVVETKYDVERFTAYETELSSLESILSMYSPGFIESGPALIRIRKDPYLLVRKLGFNSGRHIYVIHDQKCVYVCKGEVKTGDPPESMVNFCKVSQIQFGSWILNFDELIQTAIIAESKDGFNFEHVSNTSIKALTLDVLMWGLDSAIKKLG